MPGSPAKVLRQYDNQLLALLCVPTNSLRGSSKKPKRVLKFLDDLFGPDKRHLVAIRKTPEDGKPEIKGRHFAADDRAGQQSFVAEHQAAGYDLYFTGNPIKGELHKKASKDDVAEARRLWVDLDPRKDRPLEEERAQMLALGTTNLPAGIPKPNVIIDSGRGYWFFWNLETPQPTDGKDGQLTTTVKSYGRGLEQAFSPFADNCHNIDRIGRLPGTRNSKTGNMAGVLHEYSQDTPYAIENFPRASDQKKKKKPDAARATDVSVLDKYEPVTRDAAELADLDAVWITRIFDGDTDGKYQGDRSRLAFAIACELVRLEFDDQFVARVIMTTVCGVTSKNSRIIGYLEPSVAPTTSRSTPIWKR